MPVKIELEGDGAGKPSTHSDAFLDSYYRSEARSNRVLKPLWRKFLKYHKHSTFEEWLDGRDLIRKDLYDLLKISPLGAYPGGEIPQREMCDQFVKKNFDGVYHDGYTLDDVHKAIARQQRMREMLLLAPRGSTKSVINCADCVSWLLNCPDIRVFVLSGEFKLANAFQTDVKAYFHRPKDTDPTYFQALFPEYILDGNDGESAAPLWTPARILPQKEPSVWVNSIASNLSGWHCDIKKGDDVITDENCETEDTREKTNFKYDGTENLVDEWGFLDHIGTRYYPDDWYGLRLKNQREYPIQVFKRSCWKVLEGNEHVALKELTKEMVELWFPAKLNWLSLKQKMRNERSFRCQQLNEPAGSLSVRFDEDLLRARHIALGSTDPDGKIFMACDWSYGAKSSNDFSALVVARISEKTGHLTILEVSFGKWVPSELSFQFVKLYEKWRPYFTLCEEPAGGELLKMEISRQAYWRQLELKNIIWKTPDRSTNAKPNRIKGIEIMLTNGTISFVNGEWTDELMYQFVRYTGEKKNKGRADDIPDAISMLQHFMPDPQLDSEEVKKRMAHELQRDEQNRYSQYIYSGGHTTEAKTFQDWKREFVRGAEPEEQPSTNAADRIFGGNGMSS